MTEDILPRLTVVDYEDYGSLFVRAVEADGENLLVHIDVQVDDDETIPGDVCITCKSYLESSLSPGRYFTLETWQDHPLLWHYKQPFVLSSFHGRTPEPLSVVGSLLELHDEFTNGWVPRSKYFNNDLRLSELIGGGFGVLADGPELLVVAYEEVLQKYGVSTSHHRSSDRRYEDLSVMILNRSYVIAKRFWAEGRLK